MIKLDVIKSADKSYVFFGISNRIKYSIMITNLGDTKVTGVTIKDVLNKGVYFIPGTFSVNGCVQNICNIEDPINIGAIRPGSNILISFDAEVMGCSPPKEIVNKAVVTYFDEKNNIVVVESNELKIPVINICLYMSKTVDKTIACIGEVLNYSVLIRNNSNLDVHDVIFYDELSKDLQLLPSSVLFNLQPQYLENFNDGLNLGTIKSYSSIIVSFQAKIISLPEPTLITNTSKIDFSYTMLDSGVPITSFGVTCSNEVVTRIINATLTC